MVSRNSDSTDMPDKNIQAASPRLHQLVRVGPDGRPEIVGRIGITTRQCFDIIRPYHKIESNLYYDIACIFASSR